MTRPVYLLLAALFALPATLPAQNVRKAPDQGDVDEHQEGPRGALPPPHVLAERDAGGGTVKVPNTGLVNGEFFFLPIAAIKPRRLAPGQTGTLSVIVALRGSHVALPGTPSLTLVNEGPLEFGPPVLQPAGVAQAGRYAGQRIYDDTILFEAPITIAADAAFGKTPIHGSFEVPLLNGSTGRELGRYTANVQGQVWIGAPLPTPTVRSRDDAVATAVNPATGEIIRVAPRPAAAAAPETDVGGTDVGTLDAPATTDANPSDAAPNTAKDTPAALSNTYLLVGFGGIVALLVLVLLARRH